MGFPGGSAVKNLPVNAGEPGSIFGSEKVPERGDLNLCSGLFMKLH